MFTELGGSPGCDEVLGSASLGIALSRRSLQKPGEAGASSDSTVSGGPIDEGGASSKIAAFGGGEVACDIVEAIPILGDACHLLQDFPEDLFSM